MASEGKPIGVLCVARREGPAYSADDISRLSIVADEIAGLVTSDRQRQMAIVTAERQRLVRDLHDSVTQRLYSLLRLTEAAQAGLETGRPSVSEQLLPRIADHARHSLKEMRLFLYGLQPVDLEHEGLVSVLHQRLDAVEGRSDVKACLLADQEILLPLPKEVALYFIAQEGLNNVLRHADAKSVTVHLRERRGRVLLVVEDDGCGFDPRNIGKGGLGLRNMRERAAQAGGRMRLTSAPGRGTQISVSIPGEAALPGEPRRGLDEHGPDPRSHR
jgi:signal transduction histidine kinase